MRTDARTNDVIVFTTSSPTARQIHVMEALGEWFGVDIKVEAQGDMTGVSSLETAHGLKWTWHDHAILREGASLFEPMDWGVWKDEERGVVLMLPCFISEPRGMAGTAENGHHLEFDPVGVTFWALTCWAERAGEWPNDQHGRPTTVHLPWRHVHGQARFLDHAIAMKNQHHWPWVELMWGAVFHALGIAWSRRLTFKPTVDIDVAFKHLGRPRCKSTLLQVRDVLAGRWQLVQERKRVLAGQLMDPYDTYAFFNDLHRQDSLLWFVLASDRHAPHDVGLNPDGEVLPALVESLGSAHEGSRVCWHPGYRAVDQEKVRVAEHRRISEWQGVDLTAVRTHFLRGPSHKWWGMLESMGIREDMSLGWSRDVGFRSGISRSFLGYDLTEDRAMAVRIHPIAVMDVGMVLGLLWSAEEAKEKLSARMEVVAEVGGDWMSCWHNTSVSEEPLWRGWRATYLHMVKEARRLS